MIKTDKLKKTNRLGAPPDNSVVKNNLLLDEQIDGRSLKKTGRTHQLSTRVTRDFYDRVRMIAARDRLKIVELLEVAIEEYEKNRQ